MSPSWTVRSVPPALRRGELHLWSLPLDDVRDSHRLAILLTHDEQERAARFHFARDAERYVAGRARLRQLLAAYVGSDDPRAIPLAYGPHGKPALHPAPGDVQFNLAHCGGHGLLGFTRDVEIGVDLEAVRSFDDMESVMRISFSPAEREEIANHPDGAAVDAFYRCWTRKEAVLKALGSGLARPLDSFQVTISESEAGVRWMDDAPDAAGRWHLLHVRPAPELVGAAAWTGPPLSPRYYRHAA